jgi:hypothetical protein
MRIKYLVFLFLIITLHHNSIAQKRAAVWCFGDSALVNFSDTANIITGLSGVKSRGSCVSVSDSTGSLLFYSYTRAATAGRTTLVKNYLNNLIQYGDSIVGEGWYHELVIVPFPGNNNLYYLFSIGVTQINQQGLYYTIVDMSANGGLGEVIQKNVQLQSFKMVDCLTAIKHGNGRDWWVIFRGWNNSPLAPNNEWYFYLITPAGLSNVMQQNFGSMQSTGFGDISFNTSGTRMAYINYKGLIELYDFDRCTGQLSNPVTIHQENPVYPWSRCWSSEFSISGNILYVSSVASVSLDSSYLVQYDLLSPDINLSADTLWRTPFMIDMGQLKMAPDNKIYITTNYYGGYPYQDTVYNYINMNLSVINHPDYLGATCDLQPFSFSLGGKRSYFGFPNNPDYDLGPLIGSPCDTLVGINEAASATTSAEMFVYYTSSWQTAFINAQHVAGSRYSLEVFDIMGKSIFRESGKLNPPYFTKNLNCSSFALGVYTVVLITEKERLVKRFVVE